MEVGVSGGFVLVFLAALLFGGATPAAKVLVAGTGPVVLAGLLYLGAGLALSAAVGFGRVASGLSRRDIGYLAGAVVSGGIVGPVLLLWGLARTSASTASLLLAFEAVFTALLAGAVFREEVGRRTWAALGWLTAGAVVVTGGAADEATVAGAAAVTAACAAWALDNNLTREVAHADSRHVALWKGVVAGTVNLGAALGFGGTLPGPGAVVGALVVGALGYGLSLVFYVRALAELGTARTAAGFAAAPFLGAIGGVVALDEPLTPGLGAAAALMAVGTATILSERHIHRHRHEPLVHTHRHRHDEHHRHGHEGWEGLEPHAHLHRHEKLIHEHPHTPDLHHRHSHDPATKKPTGDERGSEE